MNINKLEELAKDKRVIDYPAPEAWEEDRRYSEDEVAYLEYIAAANPAAILSLIQSHRELLKTIKEMHINSIDFDRTQKAIKKAEELYND